MLSLCPALSVKPRTLSLVCLSVVSLSASLSLSLSLSLPPSFSLPLSPALCLSVCLQLHSLSLSHSKSHGPDPLTLLDKFITPLTLLPVIPSPSLPQPNTYAHWTIANKLEGARTKLAQARAAFSHGNKDPEQLRFRV